MRKKLFWSLVGFSLAISILLCGLMTGGLYLFFNQQLRQQLTQEAHAFANAMTSPQTAQALLESGVYQERITLVDADGTVLFDNRSSAASMENHAGREEIAQALETGEGWSSRDSATMGETSVYYALRLTGGQVLRVSGTQKTVVAMLEGVMGWLLAGALLCVLLSSQLARPITCALVRPINQVDLDHPLESEVYDELAPILRRMDAQNQRITSQMRKLQEQQNELNVILNGMKEGIVVLNEKRRVLAINPAARRILATGDGDLSDHTLPELNRHETLLKLLRECGTGELCACGRTYRVSVSAVHNGQVVLLQDITETASAEESRRRFTANVSHELRTPLTTISGYAEMIESGLSNPDDTPLLVGKIRKESRRMLSLIEDILRLSKLDEGVTAAWQTVDLLYLAKECVDQFDPSTADVKLTVSGISARVKGDVALLEEMLTNLIENAIKYNRPQGSVEVTVGYREDGRPYCNVTDTGVGIAPEHQEQVFERFYRVDKSRSKETGGTGLGLSIVKHGAMLHHAEIELNSAVCKGTSISIVFPEKE